MEVEPEPGAVGDRVLVRTVTVYNQSDVELGDSLTLTAEATELWHLERLPVGALPRGQRAVLTLRLRVKSDLRRPFEDAIPDTYTLTLSHASPSPPNSNGGASSSLRPPLVIAYRFPSSMRSYLKGLPGMAPRRLVTVSPEEEERPEDGAADITSTSSSSIISGSGGSGGGQSRRRPRPRPAPCNLLLLGPAGAGVLGWALVGWCLYVHMMMVVALGSPTHIPPTPPPTSHSNHHHRQVHPPGALPHVALRPRPRQPGGRPHLLHERARDAGAAGLPLAQRLERGGVVRSQLMC